MVVENRSSFTYREKFLLLTFFLLLLRIHELYRWFIILFLIVIILIKFVIRIYVLCRLFAVTRCGRCQAGISATELVMRARDSVYHLHCFSCTSCGVPLSKGDHFGMREGLIYCRCVLLLLLIVHNFFLFVLIRSYVYFWTINYNSKLRICM